MIDGWDDRLLAEQLLLIARDSRLRQLVYDQLGEYCHQCRNRLNSLKLSLFLANKQAVGRAVEDLRRIESDYVELERVVERVQILCRPMTFSPVSIGLELLIEDRRAEWTRWMALGGSELVCIPPSDPALASFDVERMGQALDAVVRWRAADRNPARSVRIRWGVEGGTAHVSWEELRSNPAAPSSPGATWELPLAVRIVLAHQGELRIIEEPEWSLRIAWPAGIKAP